MGVRILKLILLTQTLLLQENGVKEMHRCCDQRVNQQCHVGDLRRRINDSLIGSPLTTNFAEFVTPIDLRRLFCRVSSLFAHKMIPLGFATSMHNTYDDSLGTTYRAAADCGTVDIVTRCWGYGLTSICFCIRAIRVYIVQVMKYEAKNSISCNANR